MRSVDEWIGKTDDVKVPARVRARIFDREGGICHLTGRKINPPADQWDLDHRLALVLGGQHRESNLFPALREAHKRKTSAEVTIKSKIANVRKKHLGIKKSKSSLSHPHFKKCMDGTVIDKRTGKIVPQSGRD